MTVIHFREGKKGRGSKQERRDVNEMGSNGGRREEGKDGGRTGGTENKRGYKRDGYKDKEKGKEV